MNKNILIEPLYNLKWESKWPILDDTNLVRIKNIAFTNQTRNKKDIKLTIVHSLNHERSHDIKKPCVQGQKVTHIAHSSHYSHISDISRYILILEICSNPTLQNSVSV